MLMVSSFPWVTLAQNDENAIDKSKTDLLFAATTEWDSLIDILIVDQEVTNEKRWLILKYCDTVLQKNKVWNPDNNEAKDLQRFGFDNDKYKYDPRQSLFVYAMCVNIDETSKGRKIANTDYIWRNYKEVFEKVTYDESVDSPELQVDKYWKDDVQFNDVRGIPSQSSLDADSAFSTCDPAKTMQSCNFSSIMPTIFKNIMNEYSNIKLASIYWYTRERESNPNILDDAVLDFSQKYFGDPAIDFAPCWVKGMSYLNSESTDWKTQHCNHPETNKELKETIKSAKRLIDKLQFLDHERMLTPFEDDEKNLLLAEYCYDKVTGTTPKHILHGCGFTNRWDVWFHSDRQIFSNLMVNELMWYNLFLDYYTNRITTNTSYAPMRLWSISFTYRRNLKEVKNIGVEKWLAQQAVSQTLRMLTNVYTSFPSYIALKAYQEDLLNYRETLVKTYTPTHQLYYTFRNVQACQDWQ